jgi:hypothetical protein
MNSVHRSFRAALLAALTCLATRADAASVELDGYASSFDTQPAAADWATASMAGRSGDIWYAATLGG